MAPEPPPAREPAVLAMRLPISKSVCYCGHLSLIPTPLGMVVLAAEVLS